MKTAKIQNNISFKKLYATPKAQKAWAFRKNIEFLKEKAKNYDIKISTVNKYFFNKKFRVEILSNEKLLNKRISFVDETKNSSGKSLRGKVLTLIDKVEKKSLEELRKGITDKDIKKVKEAFDKINKIFMDLG